MAAGHLKESRAIRFQRNSVQMAGVTSRSSARSSPVVRGGRPAAGEQVLR
ncbi:hypothetical protein ACFWN1_23435 [Streptomyces sp. NPDC058459]